MEFASSLYKVQYCNQQFTVIISTILDTDHQCSGIPVNDHQCRSFLSSNHQYLTKFLLLSLLLLQIVLLCIVVVKYARFSILYANVLFRLNYCKVHNSQNQQGFPECRKFFQKLKKFDCIRLCTQTRRKKLLKPWVHIF